MRLIYYYCYLLCMLLCVASVEQKIQLQIPDTKFISLQSGDTITFNVMLPKQMKLHPLFSVFYRLAVVISGKNQGGSLYQFPFHSIRGVSSDDSHSHFTKLFQSVIKKIGSSTNEINTGESTILVNQVTITSNFIRNFIRDIFSSCPSPLFGHSTRNRCAMSLSPYGTASISVQPKSKSLVVIQVSTRYEFMYQYPVYFIVAVLFLLFSDQFSKSKIFQYCCGIAVFVTFGLILILLSLTGTIKPKSTIIQNVSLFTLLTSAYGASVVWFLRTYLSLLLMHFWEFTACYAVIFAGLGAWAVRYIRSNIHTKHVFRVSVKWMIRLGGLYFLFNASASPIVSWTYMLIFLILYIIYEFTKRSTGLKQKKD